MKQRNRVFLTLVTSLSLFFLGCRSEKKVETDLESKERFLIKSLSLSFVPPKGWKQLPQEQNPKGGLFAGVKVEVLHSFYAEKYGALCNISELKPENNLDDEWLLTYQDSIKAYLDSEGKVDFKEYKVDIFDVSHWKMVNKEAMVHKIFCESPYNHQFMVDFILPQETLDSAIIQSVMNSATSFSMIQ